MDAGRSGFIVPGRGHGCVAERRGYVREGRRHGYVLRETWLCHGRKEDMATPFRGVAMSQSGRGTMNPIEGMIRACFYIQVWLHLYIGVAIPSGVLGCTNRVLYV